MNAITRVSDHSEAIRVLQNSLYPGARPESVELVLAWCQATGRDPMKKPIHIVPMYVKDAITGQGSMRDVLMPGIGTYRSDAASTGQYVGKSEPEFGPDVTQTLGGVQVTFPQWCKVTVMRLVEGKERAFTAKEFWLENYATAKRDTDQPNAMWKKRPYGQLAKCAESQALRMAFPDETGNTNTAEEMEGKAFDNFTGPTIDAKPEPVRQQPRAVVPDLDDSIPALDESPMYPLTARDGTRYLSSADEFIAAWEKLISNMRRADALDRLASMHALNASALLTVEAHDMDAANKVRAMIEAAQVERASAATAQEVE